MQRFLSALPIRWALLLVTGLWSILAVAQSTCPELKVSDFKVNYYAANADCGTAGQIIVTYRNNVAGFSKLTYETSTDGATWANPVEQTSLSVPTTIPLTGWAAGQTIHLRVTGTCPSGTQEVTFPTLTHRSEQPHAVAPVFETTPAGGCSATAGSIDVSVGAVTGFTKAEYRLYQGTTLLNSMTSNTPYAESTFYNLPSGTYKVVMRATPACTPTSPGATFKNGAYEVEKTVKVGYFSILPTPIPTRGTCDGGVRVAVARMMGVNSIKYEVLKGGVVLQTQQLTFPNFTHTFLSLPVGNYEVRATTDCGSIETVPFTVPVGTPGTLEAKIIRNTYSTCEKGIIQAYVPGTTEACPVTYTLIPKSHPGSPMVKSGITDERGVRFENLPQGYYDLEATWGGQTQKKLSIEIHMVSLGKFKLSATNAQFACDPSGSVTVELVDGVYDESSTLVLSVNGTAVRTIAFSQTDRKKKIENLVPAGYDLKLTTECGESIVGFASVAYKELTKLNYSIPQDMYDKRYSIKYDPCTGTYKLPLKGTAPSNPVKPEERPVARFMQGATYEVYIAGELVGSGVVPAKDYDKEVYWLSINKLGNENDILDVRLIPSCGSPVVSFKTFVGGYTGPNAYATNVTISSTSTTCENNGKASLNFYQGPGYPYTVRILKTSDGSQVYSTEVTAVTQEQNTSVALENLSAGKYTAEIFSTCNATLKETYTFEIPDQETSPPEITLTPACGTPTGSIIYKWGNNRLTTYEGRLVNSAGITVKTQDFKSQIVFTNLPPDTYTLYTKAKGPTCMGSEKAWPAVKLQSAPTSSMYNVELIAPYEKVPTDVKTPHFCQNDGVGYFTIYKSVNRDNLPLPITWHLYDRNGVELETQVANTVEEYVRFSHIPSGSYTVAIDTPCGQVKKAFTTYPVDYNEIQKHIQIQPRNIYPSCQSGAILVKTDLLPAGYPNLPTKMKVSQRLMERTKGGFTDSISSAGVMALDSITGMPPGNYDISFTYCGIDFNYSVDISQVTDLAIAPSYSQIPCPCEDTYALVSLQPLDSSLEVEWVAVNKDTGTEENRKKVNGGAAYKLLLPPGDYDIKAIIKGPCAEVERETTVKVYDGKLQGFANYPNPMDCHNNGYFEFGMYNGCESRFDNVQFSVQSTSGGLPKVGVTNDPKKRVLINNLSAGTYNLKAVGTCKTSSGVVKQYEWKQDNMTLVNGYTTMNAVPNPSYTIGSAACNPTGSIGLSIYNGNKQKRHVYIRKDPSGTVYSPEKEIFVKGAAYYSSNDETTWGEKLAPGNYDIRINDECQDYFLTVNVPLKPDLAKVSSVACSDLDNQGCNIRHSITVDFRDIPGPGRQEFLYEVAITPPGQPLSATQRWSSDWFGNYLGWQMENGVNVRKTLTAMVYVYTPYFDVMNGGIDVWLRLKGCPASARKYHFNTKLNNPFYAGFDRIDCDRNRIFLSMVDPCSGKTYDISVREGYQDWSGAEIHRVNGLTFSGPRFQTPPETDFIIPANKIYTLFVVDPLTSLPIQWCDRQWAGISSAYSKDVQLKYVITEQSTDCGGEYYEWRTESQCEVKAKFYIYDITNGTPILKEQSTGYASSWKSNLYYIRSHKYRIVLLDQYGNKVLGTDFEHTVDFVTPSSYTYGSHTFGGFCRGKQYYWYPPTDSSPDGSDIIPIYPPGTPGEKKRIPRILKLEIRHTPTGNVYFNNNPIWSQVYKGVAGQKSEDWKVRYPDGTIGNDTKIPLGNYTLTVTEDCHVVPGQPGKMDMLEPEIYDFSATEVTMDCQGQFTVTPKGWVKFPDRPGTITLKYYTMKSEDYNIRHPWGSSYKTYRLNDEMRVTYEYIVSGYPYTCEISWHLDYSRLILDFDGSSSASYFCTGSNKGDITIGLKGGHPPYTYTLKRADGTVVATKTSNGPVNFQEGKLGDVYRVDATDACNVAHIYQDVLLQDPKEIGYTMNRTFHFCDGAASTFEALNLAGASYDWTGPNGFTSSNRQVSITATSNTAGNYHLKVRPATCNMYIEADVKVNVVKVKEVGTTVEKRLCAGETANINIGAPETLSNGLPSTDQKYQWQMTEDPAAQTGWRAIAGATSEQLTYTPPYQGTFFVRRLTKLGDCSDLSPASKIVADPGLNSIVSNDELNITIDHKNPFTLTAGFVTGNPSRTYQWQRSLDKTTWTNIAGATDQTYTETRRYGAIVYYKRITSAGTCSTESPIITVRFKKRYPAMVNPHLRQRVLTE